MKQRTLIYKRPELVLCNTTLEGILSTLSEVPVAQLTREYELEEIYEAPSVAEEDTCPRPKFLIYRLGHVKIGDQENTKTAVLFGHAIRYTPGVAPSLLSRDPTTSRPSLAPVSERLPDCASGTEAHSCFIVKDNDVIMMSDTNLSCDRVSFLLRRLCLDNGKLNPGSTFTISDYAYVPKKGRVRGIQKVGIELDADKLAKMEGDRAPDQNKLFGHRLTNWIHSFPGEMKGREARQYRKVKLSLVVKFDRGVRSKDSSVLDEVLPLIPEEMLPFVTLEIPKLGTRKGSSLQLRCKKSVDYSLGYPDAVDAATKMYEYYKQLDHSGALKDDAPG